MGPDYKPMTREEAIEKLSKVESKKIEYVAGMIVMANVGQFPRERLKMGEEMSKYQALDELYDEISIEEGDIVVAVQKYTLDEDPEFKAMIEGMQSKLKAKVEEGIAEIQAKAQEEARKKQEEEARQSAEFGIGTARVFGAGSVGKDGAPVEDLGW